MAITHNDLVTMLVAARPVVSDEFALQTIDMFPMYQVGITISAEDITKGFDRYQYEGELYKCIQPHTTQADWTPDKTPALWVKVSLEEYPEWVQPAGSQDAYSKGDKVTHNNKKWTSDSDANVWEPGVYGWTEVVE